MTVQIKRRIRDRDFTYTQKRGAEPFVRVQRACSSVFCIRESLIAWLTSNDRQNQAISPIHSEKELLSRPVKSPSLTSRLGFLGGAGVLLAILIADLRSGFVTGAKGAFAVYRSVDPKMFWVILTAHFAIIVVFLYLGLRRSVAESKK